MNSFLLKFQDKFLEKTFQKDLKFAKFLNFHYFLILEMILILLVTIFILIIRGINAPRIIGVFMCLIFITLTVLMAKKLKNWEYLLHIQILLHLSIIVIAVEMIIETYKTEDDKIYEIMGVPIHLSFFCILLTRLNWLICAIFYFFFNIFYVLRLFTFERIENQPMIIVLHIICVIGFSFMVFYQEKTTRIFYQLIHDSNQNSLQFELVMKNIFPSPIFIIDFHYKKLKFFNNAANEFMDDFNDEGIIGISPREQKTNRYLSEEIENFIEKDSFSRFTKMISKFKFSNQNNNENALFEKLLDYFNNNKYNTQITTKLESQNTLDFENLNIHFEKNNLSNSNSSPTNQISTRKYYNLKYIKMNWQHSKALLIVLSDMTELHELEELKHLDDYKNKLLATVSHDLRTPVNGMINMIELVLPKLNDKKDIKNLVIAVRSGHLLMNMINDILDFSQINNKKLRLTFQQFDLISILKETSKLLKFKIKSKGLQFIVDLPKDIDCLIISDSTRIKQIILNLLTNALKFTSKGYIKLKMEEIITSTKKLFKISVEDTGIGIKKEDETKLFKLFGKLEHNDRTLNTNGVGLGLTISKNLAKMLNSNDQNGIYLETKWGKGSNFWFYLENEENYFENTNSTIPNENKQLLSINNEIDINTNIFNNNNKKKILIVDDDMINQMVAKKYCEFYCIEFLTANDGTEAVELIKNLIQKENFMLDLILMDLNMPVMDGNAASIEILKILKENNKKKIPIIIMSAGIVSKRSMEEESLIKDYIFKPISKIQFANIISKYLKS